MYQRNLDMIPLKDQQRVLDDQIRAIADLIYDRETNILSIQMERLKPKQKQLEGESRNLELLEKQLSDKKAALTIDGFTYDQLKDTIDAMTEQYNLAVDLMGANKANSKAVADIHKNWVAVGSAIAAANRTAKENKSNADSNYSATVSSAETGSYLEKKERDAAVATAKAKAGVTRSARFAVIDAERAKAIALAQAGGAERMASFGMAAGGNVKGIVSGDGSRDSVLKKLTPGEFVVRKAMVNKYGKSFMSDINTGSFQMPKYKVSSSVSMASGASGGTTADTVSPVYNTYSVNVNVPNANINADEVAQKVMYKIKSMDSGSVRSYNGF